MFKNDSNCERCTHTSVCQYKLELKEICNKIGGKWDNIAPPDIFNLKLNCDQYREDITVRNNGGFLC